VDQELIAYLDGRFAELGETLSTRLRQDLGTQLRQELSTQLRQELGAGLSIARQELGAEVRREIGVAVEHFDGKIQQLAELMQIQNQQHERHHAEIWTELSTLGQRLTHLHARVLELSERGR